jgi:hypothetical protein
MTSFKEQCRSHIVSLLLLRLIQKEYFSHPAIPCVQVEYLFYYIVTTNPTISI